MPTTNVNTGINTHVGKTTNNDDSQHTTNTDFHLIEIHWPTAGWGFGLVLLGSIIILAVYVWYKRRQRRMKNRIHHQRQLTWEAMEWHRATCTKVESTRICDCRKVGDRELQPNLDMPGDNRRDSYYGGCF